MTDRNSLIFGSLAAAAAVGVYLVVRPEEQEEPPPLADQEGYDGGAYDPDDSDRFTQDRGGAVSASQFDRSGNTVERMGAENYQPGNTVSGNLPLVFGAKSYRNSMCTLSSDSYYTSAGGDQGRIWGPSRRASRSARNGWEWNRATWQSGDLGSWLTNGVPIVAKSWSCGANERTGTNNVNCRSRRKSSADGGGLGLYPMDISVHAKWRNQAEEGVPLIEYAGDAGEALSGQRKYTNLPSYKRMSGQGKTGFLARDGRLWIRTVDSVNFRHISDEDPDVEYFVAGVGRMGGVTARRVSNGKSVAREDFRPRWKQLSYNDCRQLLRVQQLEKVDPWSIPESPWAALDQMGNGSWSFGGENFELDFRAARRLNPTFRALVQSNPVLITEVRSGDIVMPDFVSFRNDGLVGDWNWPVINYGLVNPYAGTPGQPNAMPVDFGAPVILNYFADMPYVRLKFSGDS